MASLTLLAPVVRTITVLIFASLLPACTTIPPDTAGLTADEARILASASPAVLSVDTPAARALLERPSRPVEPGAPWIGHLAALMERTVRKRKGGGLAAVQLGIPVRVVVLRRRAGAVDRFQVFVNPELAGRSAERIASFEHCLSVPWGYRYTERPARVSVRFATPEGNPAIESLEGDEAVVFQQELDHLDGILLNRGLARRSFIPGGEMEAFMAGVLRECRADARSDCPALLKARWAERAQSSGAP